MNNSHQKMIDQIVNYALTNGQIPHSNLETHCLRWLVSLADITDGWLTGDNHKVINAIGWFYTHGVIAIELLAGVTNEDVKPLTTVEVDESVFTIAFMITRVVQMYRESEYDEAISLVNHTLMIVQDILNTTNQGITIESCVARALEGK